jgi:hypothetical protein
MKQRNTLIIWFLTRTSEQNVYNQQPWILKGGLWSTSENCARIKANLTSIIIIWMHDTIIWFMYYSITQGRFIVAVATKAAKKDKQSNWQSIVFVLLCSFSTKGKNRLRGVAYNISQLKTKPKDNHRWIRQFRNVTRIIIDTATGSFRYPISWHQTSAHLETTPNKNRALAN